MFGDFAQRLIRALAGGEETPGALAGNVGQNFLSGELQKFSDSAEAANAVPFEEQFQQMQGPVEDVVGVSGLKELLGGDFSVGTLLDVLGVGLDVATPGIPIMGGLGFFESAARLGSKIPDKRTLEAVGEHGRQIVGDLSGTRRADPSFGTPSVLGTEGKLSRGLQSVTGDAEKSVMIQIPPSTTIPDGLEVTARRSFKDPTEVQISGIFMQGGEGVGEATQVGPRAIAQVRDILTKEFPGVKTITADRVSGARQGGRVVNAASENVGGRDLVLDVTKRGERALQESNPFLDFITTLLSNSNELDRMEVLEDLLQAIAQQQ